MSILKTEIRKLVGRSTATLAAAMLLCGMVGCSTLNVNVDVLDKSRVDPVASSFNSINQSISEIQAQDRRDELATKRASMKTLLRTTLVNLEGTGVIAKGDGLKFAPKGETYIDSAFQEAINHRRQAVTIFERFLLMKNDRMRLSTLRSAQAEIKAADATLAGLNEQLQKLVEDTVKPGPGEAAPSEPTLRVVTAFATDLKQIVNSIIVGTGLFDDPYAAVVVGAPEAAWSHPFSHSKAFNALGNSDIAIRAEKIARGNFTLKGVRLDAQKVTQATFQAFKQTVQLVAIAYGVPLPKAAPPKSGDTSTSDPAQDASDEVAQAETTVRTSRSQRRSIRRAELNLVSAILKEEEKLGGDDTFKAGSQNIQNAFKQYRPLIAAEATTTTPAPSTP